MAHRPKHARSRRRPPTAPPAAPAAPARDRRLVTAISVVGGLVTLVSGLVGLVFVLRPQLKPDPPPAHKAAHLREVGSKAMSFGHYLDRLDEPTGTFTARRLAEPGRLVTFHFSITGYEDRKLPVHWQLFTAPGGDRVGQSRAVSLRALAPTDEGNWSVWIPLPRTGARFSAIVELLDPTGRVPLDQVETHTFSRR